MKFRQRTYSLIIFGAVVITLTIPYFFFRQHPRTMQFPTPLDVQRSCWPTIHYPRRNLTSLHLFSSRIYGQRAVYSSDGEADFMFLNDIPPHRTPMKVFIIPHSHNDPAWIKTFADYYDAQTQYILKNIFTYLEKFKSMTFLWTEPVFLDHFFRTTPSSFQAKQELKEWKSFMKQGRLDIGAGGWISPDEATTTHYALISQLTEGLWWLKSNLNFTPETYWNIDPFGYSQTMPFILRKANFKHVNVVRINENVKDLLRRSQSMEFKWSAFWDQNSEGIIANVLPFMLYNIKYSCGPVTSNCLMFDFRQERGEDTESQAVPITSSNVARFAELLYKQLELKSRMYRHNVVMFPIGDDFRFDREAEWEQQYINFKKIIDYINSQKKWNVDIRFGTLQDYYRELAKRQVGKKLPTFAGDFYPYTDRDEVYWTGYFTTRPLLKRRIRIAENWVRSAEILASLQFLRDCNSVEAQLNENNLTTVRRDFAFLQHHDAIAGTSKPFVMDTYYERIQSIFSNTSRIIIRSLNSLTNQDLRLTTDYENEPTLKLKEEVFVLINSKEEPSHECFHVITESTRVSVLTENKEMVTCQVNPRITRVKHHPTYEVAFCLPLPALSVRQVFITQSGSATCVLAKVWTNDKMKAETKWSLPVESVSNIGKDFAIKTPHLHVQLDRIHGFPTAVTIGKNGVFPAKPVSVSCSFFGYTGSNSGAYIFSPDTQAPTREILAPNHMWLFDGPVEGGALVQAMWEYEVRIIKNPATPLSRAIRIRTYFNNPSDVVVNREIVLRVEIPGLNSGLDFFTDANGLALARRRRQPALPVQANYHPATSAAVIEDPELRLNLILSQSMGATSIAPGSLEVMMFRQPGQDDMRGLGEGVQETEPVPAEVLLLLENCSALESCDQRSNSPESDNPQPGDFLSSTAASLERILNRPSLVMQGKARGHAPAWSWTDKAPSNSFRIVNFRRLPGSNKLLLVLRNPGQSSCHNMNDVPPSRPLTGMDLHDFVHRLLGPDIFRITSVQSSDLTGIQRQPPLRTRTDWNVLQIGTNDLISLVLTVRS